MLKSKKIIIAVVVFTLFILIGLLVYLKNINAKGNIDNVERIIKTENGHKKEDIEKVFTMIEKKFNTKNYKDCELKKITYGKYSVNGKSKEEVYKEKYNADEVIYLKLEYKTGNNPPVGFVRNEDYEDTAVFVKIDDNWELKEYGQGI